MKNIWINQAKEKRLAKYLLNRGKMSLENASVALLFENQRLANELGKEQVKATAVITNTELHDLYSRVTTNAVRKIFGPANFLAGKLISVQPMSHPVDKVEFLRFRYRVNDKPKSFDSTLYMMNPEYAAPDAPKEELPEINLVVEKEECTAKTRRMKTVFPLSKITESEDLKRYDKYYLTKDFSEKYPETKEFMEEEMASYMAKCLTDEINAEILTDLVKNCGTVGTMNYATILGDTLKEKYEGLYIKIVELSGIIHRKTLRGGCNWVVTSPEIAEIFISATAGFVPAHSEQFKQKSPELVYCGTLNNRWKLYSSKTAIHRNVMLLGYKGDSNLDAGYFYNPYIPITPIEAPEGQIGTLSRYSKKLLREGAKFYARLNLEGF